MASQEQSGHDGFIREKMWVKRPAGTHLSDSQKRPGEHSPLTRDDDTNELGHVTLEKIGEDEDDASANWQPSLDYGATADAPPARSPEDDALVQALVHEIVTLAVIAAVKGAPHVKRWWDSDGLPAMRSTMKSARNMKTAVASTLTSTMSSTVESARNMQAAAVSTVGSARSRIARGRKADRQDDGAELVVLVEAATTGPAGGLAAVPAASRARMSSAEAQQRLAAALTAQAISEKAKAFSDEQLRMLLSAVIEDANEVRAVSGAVEQLTPQELEKTVSRILEANPGFVEEFVKTLWTERATLPDGLEP
jgi:hypothetical protein